MEGIGKIKISTALKNYKKHLICLIFSSFIILFCLVMQNKYPNSVQLDAYDKNSEIQPFAEIYEGMSITQIMSRPLEEISGVKINVATYGKSSVNGDIIFTVYNNNELIGKTSIDGKRITDYCDLLIPLFNKKGSIGDEFQIIVTGTNSADNHIALWIRPDSYNHSAYLSANKGDRVKGITQISFLTQNCNASRIWWIFIAWAVVCFYVFVDWKKYFALYAKNYLLYAFLFLLAFAVLCLRGGVFTYSQIFAEDGIYLDRIIHNGFLRSAFETRHQTSADFYNVGLFTLCYLSWCLNKLFYGYNLIYLPIFYGLVSSAFYAGIATYAFHTFKKINKILASCSFLISIFIPVGLDNAQIFGRIGNLVYLFSFLTVLVLLNIWEERYKISVKNYVLSFIVLICGLTFPISFVALAFYLFVLTFESMKTERKRDCIIANFLLIITFIIGCLLIPKMIGCQGGSAGMVTKKRALVEFVLARHFLFSFVYIFYNKLNDIFVIFLSVFSFSILIFAVYVEYKKKKSFGKFAISCVLILPCIFASAVVRIVMSQLFSNYSSTSPDHYYYVCNIMFAVLVLYGILTIIANLKMNIKIFTSVIIILQISLLANENLFFIKGRDDYSLASMGYDWGLQINAALDNNVLKDNEYQVRIPPLWGTCYMSFPKIYIFSSMQRILGQN